MKDFLVKPFDFGADNIKAIRSPTLFIFGDSDALDPDHILELFRLRGGWTDADFTGLPESQLAIFPGTSHTGLIMQTELLVKAIGGFLSN
jgi:pimeloyl-ACP methyl ester carboxylesterase